MPKPTASHYTNKQLADTFTLIGDLLEIKGEIIYKTLAAKTLAESSSRDSGFLVLVTLSDFRVS